MRDITLVPGQYSQVIAAW